MTWTIFGLGSEGYVTSWITGGEDAPSAAEALANLYTAEQRHTRSLVQLGVRYLVMRERAPHASIDQVDQVDRAQVLMLEEVSEPIRAIPA